MAQATNLKVLLTDDIWISRQETLEELTARFFELDEGPPHTADDAHLNPAYEVQELLSGDAGSEAVVASPVATDDDDGSDLVADSDVEVLVPFGYPDLNREPRENKPPSPRNIAGVTLYQFGRRGLVYLSSYSTQNRIEKKKKNTPWLPLPFSMENFSNLSDSEHSGSVELEMISKLTVSSLSLGTSFPKTGSSSVVESDPKTVDSMSSGRIGNNAKRPQGSYILRRALRWFSVGRNRACKACNIRQHVQ